MTIRERLDVELSRRVLILDGAMGTMIQAFGLEERDFRGERFAEHPMSLKGCNDLLCLTAPSVVASIHEAYLRAGADIIETCSFNATSVSLADYGLSGLAYEINRAAAALARRSAERYTSSAKPRFVAGILGPTSKTASISPDVEDPGARGIGWDELVVAYRDSVRGLLDGGAELLMVETIFDTLNAKAALHAIRSVLDDRNVDVPIMVSGTIVDAAGRTLSGQTVEAFHASVAPFEPWSVGLNCALGAERLRPHLEALAAAAPTWTSVHPNAGLPNRFGEYDESAETTGALIDSFLADGLANIVGGCCGTTPAHIAAIAAAAAKRPPRRPPAVPRLLRLSGLEPLVLDGPTGFVDVGERTNVAGSRKFLRLVKEGKYSESLSVARDMVDAGAGIIDVCMDDALLDGEEAMTRFLALAQSDPEIARVPVMIDSSRWELILAGLRMIQGKCLVNSISLKEGEDAFLRKAREARSYGAAVVVMLFDEAGQADGYERKIEVARRSYGLLTGAGFPAEDIVFDPNVLAVATGIPEHDRYALDFIRACSWIKEHCPGASLSGGVSNLSFSFRGVDEVREAMHAVFLRHAAAAGLSMAIVNPASLVSYDELDGDLRELAEDVVLARRSDAAERLLAAATEIREAKESDKAGPGEAGKAAARQAAKDAWREADVEERIVHALLRGVEDWIEQDVLEARPRYARALDVIEGPLMRGMDEVGARFGAGRMFLPQVIRSARVMKRAVAVLEPYIQAEKTGDDRRGRGTIVMATVKGDVHDIGKNIVGVVLGCNGYRVVDLGVMVPADEILEAARREEADLIGLSGLITPSLEEMVHVAKEMERRSFSLPLLIGGATTSEAHTALRIAPVYSKPVVYVKDASRAASTVKALLSSQERPAFLERLEAVYRDALERHQRIGERGATISLQEARDNRFRTPEGSPATAPRPATIGVRYLGTQDIEELIPYIDWAYFFYAWDLGHGFERILEDPEKGEAARKLYADARAILDRIVAEGLLIAKGAVGFFPAGSDGDDLVLFAPPADGSGAPGGLGAGSVAAEGRAAVGNPSGLAAGTSAAAEAAAAEARSGRAAAPTGSSGPADAGRREIARFRFTRNQERKLSGGPNPCLADFVASLESGKEDWIGLFAVTAGHGATELAERYAGAGDDYSALLVKTLADRLAEAYAERLHERVRKELWGYAPEERLSVKELIDCAYRGIRPAFGYPACPDHADKEIAFELLGARESCGMDLTESYMMTPAASVCGLYFANPAAYYFGADRVGEDQLVDWAARKGLPAEEARRRLGRR